MFEKLDGRALNTLIAVYEMRNLSKAAKKLGYVQSTVTAHIRQMEETCGRQLFQRLPRGMEPTEAGHEAAGYAYRMRRLTEEMEAAMTDWGEPQGDVRLQVLESFCTVQMPGLLNDFIRRFPAIHLQLRTGFFRDTVQAVADRHVELGIDPATRNGRTCSLSP
jgi:LysR family transcriptional regulator, cell division regulator